MNVPDINLADIKIGAWVKQPKVKNAEGFFTNAFPFWKHLSTYEFVDVATYTYDNDFAGIVNVRRLLHCRPLLKGFSGQERRQVLNLHAKLYLGYSHHQINAFIGSWNLVAPTFLELICVLPKEAERVAVNWYDSIWREAGK